MTRTVCIIIDLFLSSNSDTCVTRDKDSKNCESSVCVIGIRHLHHEIYEFRKKKVRKKRIRVTWNPTLASCDIRIRKKKKEKKKKKKEARNDAHNPAGMGCPR